MDFTWGFISLFVLFIIPGLLFRRFYFFGEFSKQFGYTLPILKTFGYSLIPGIIIVIGVFPIYEVSVESIDLGRLIDLYKDLSDPDFKFSDHDGTPIKEVLYQTVLPFVGFIYIISAIIGMVSGQTVYLLGLDKGIKFLRFNNHWHYLFYCRNKKAKNQGINNSKKTKFLFSQIDIKVKTETGNKLYTGFLVDYELDPNNGSELSNVVLRNACRYIDSYEKQGEQKSKKRIPIIIPGDLFVIDCQHTLDLNITYVYGEKQDFLNSKGPDNLMGIIGLLFILIIPLFIFELSWIDLKFYEGYFDCNWVSRILYYLSVVMLISSFIPFKLKENSKTYVKITWKEFFVNIIAVFILYGLARLISLI